MAIWRIPEPFDGREGGAREQRGGGGGGGRHGPRDGDGDEGDGDALSSILRKMDIAAEGMTSVRQKEMERLGARMKDLELERDVAIEEISRLQQESDSLRDSVRSLSIAAKSARQEVKEVQENERVSNQKHIESIMEINRLQHALMDANDGFERNIQTLQAEHDLELQEFSSKLNAIEARCHRKSAEANKLKRTLLRRQKIMHIRFILLRSAHCLTPLITPDSGELLQMET
eukprot:760348-Hanusia_phi.AAC.5